MADTQKMDGVNGKLFISDDFGPKTLTWNPRTLPNLLPLSCMQLPNQRHTPTSDHRPQYPIQFLVEDENTLAYQGNKVLANI